MPFDVTRYKANLVVRDRMSWLLRIFMILVGLMTSLIVIGRPWPDVALWQQAVLIFLIALISLTTLIAIIDPSQTLLVSVDNRTVVIGRRWLTTFGSETLGFNDIARIHLIVVPPFHETRSHELRLDLRNGATRPVASSGDYRLTQFEQLARDLSQEIGVPLYREEITR